MVVYGREVADKRYDGPVAAVLCPVCESQYNNAPYLVAAQ